jgi:hypothetical protein
MFLDIPAPTFNEFGIYYFVFGMFIVLAGVMYYFIVVADPLPQYDIKAFTKEYEETDEDEHKIR